MVKSATLVENGSDGKDQTERTKKELKEKCQREREMMQQRIAMKRKGIEEAKEESKKIKEISSRKRKERKKKKSR